VAWIKARRGKDGATTWFVYWREAGRGSRKKSLKAGGGTQSVWRSRSRLASTQAWSAEVLLPNVPRSANLQTSGWHCASLA
jgi:hypothetical protein